MRGCWQDDTEENEMTDPTILTLASGILATLLGAGLGCLVLELTVRAVKHTLTPQPVKERVASHTGSLPWLAAAGK